MTKSHVLIDGVWVDLAYEAPQLKHSTGWFVDEKSAPGGSETYCDQAGKHVLVWWVDSGAPGGDVEPLTKDAIRKLEELAADAQAKRDSYYEFLSRHGLAE